jgi:tetrahydromethanopterin S-methyltransferase subunit F
VQGLSNIHPIYEALTALLKKNLADQQFVNRYAKDENSLRESIAADVLLEHVKPKEKQHFMSLFQSGATLKDIVDGAALSIAENKRIKDGRILYLAADEAYSEPYFMAALKNISPSMVYIDSSAIEDVREKAKRVKRRRKLKIIGGIAAGAAGLILLAGAYVAHQKDYFDIRFGNPGNRVESRK